MATRPNGDALMRALLMVTIITLLSTRSRGAHYVLSGRHASSFVLNLRSTIAGGIDHENNPADTAHLELFPSIYPIIPGHEYLGEVVEIGHDFKPRDVDIKISDRVVYWGQTDFGGLAEYWTVQPIFSGEVKEDIFPADRNFFDDKRAAVVQIPDDLSDLEASFIEPTTGALRSLLTNPPKIGDKVITGSVIKRVLAPNSVLSMDVNKDRNFYAEEHFSQRAYLPDELIETAVKVTDESKDPRSTFGTRSQPGLRIGCR